MEGLGVENETRWNTSRIKLCDTCGKTARLVHDIELYGRPVLDWPFHWWCPNCYAHINCKPGTDIPVKAMDSIAVKEARRQAHRHFDRLWRTKPERTKAYSWLARQMNMSPKECHIGMFTIDQCKDVIRLAKERLENRNV